MRFYLGRQSFEKLMGVFVVDKDEGNKPMLYYGVEQEDQTCRVAGKQMPQQSWSQQCPGTEQLPRAGHIPQQGRDHHHLREYGFCSSSNSGRSQGVYLLSNPSACIALYNQRIGNCFLMFPANTVLKNNESRTSTQLMLSTFLVDPPRKKILLKSPEAMLWHGQVGISQLSSL